MLIDTSGFLCRYEEREINHENAIELYESATSRVTTNYVLAEYTALVQVRGIPREQIIDFSERILGDVEVEIVWVDEPLHSLAVELLKQRSDKTYSLCDAVSFALMRERGIAEALTTDRHFEQEGFVRLLKR
jgi:uncharacterized protein